MPTSFASEFQRVGRRDLAAVHGETGTFTTRAGVTTSGLTLLVHRHGTDYAQGEHGAVLVERATVHVATTAVTVERHGWFTVTGPDDSSQKFYVQGWRARAGDYVCECEAEHAGERLHAPRTG